MTLKFFSDLGPPAPEWMNNLPDRIKPEPDEESEEEYREEGCYSPNGDPVNMMPHDWTDAGEGFSRCRICGKVVE